MALLRSIACLLVCCAASTAVAGCSRTMDAPVAPVGESIIISGDKIDGIYAELFAYMTRGGCEVRLRPVPRARQEMLFESGKSDLLAPASRTPRRDRVGYFVPMIQSRAMLMSIDAGRPPVGSVAELVRRKELRVALVRGYDYGDAYNDMIKQLSAQGRLKFEADPANVARLLQKGIADVTVMAPSILYATTQNDPRVRELHKKIRMEALEELAWGESGVYISRTSVSEADRKELEGLLNGALKSGTLWDSYKRHYPVKTLADSMRQR